jgi:hypothetical protein
MDLYPFSLFRDNYDVSIGNLPPVGTAVEQNSRRKNEVHTINTIPTHAQKSGASSLFGRGRDVLNVGCTNLFFVCSLFRRVGKKIMRTESPIIFFEMFWISA